MKYLITTSNVLYNGRCLTALTILVFLIYLSTALFVIIIYRILFDNVHWLVSWWPCEDILLFVGKAKGKHKEYRVEILCITNPTPRTPRSPPPHTHTPRTPRSPLWNQYTLGYTINCHLHAFNVIIYQHESHIEEYSTLASINS